MLRKTLILSMFILIGTMFVGCVNDEDENPIIIDENSVELLQDPTFSTGFNLLGISPVIDGRTIQMKLDYNGEAVETEDNIWYMAQWWTPYNVVDANYSFREGIHSYETASRTIEVNPEDEGYLHVKLNSSIEYLGETRIQGQPWTHLLIEQTFPASVKMSELESLILTLDVSVDKVVNLNGDAYDPGLHAAQLLWYLTLRNNVPEDSNSEEVGSRGDFLWFGIPIYDNRSEFISDSAHIDQGAPGTTNKLIYSIGSANYFNEPLKMGKTYNIQFDVLPYIREAFIYAVTNNALVNAQFENMEIGYMNFGWELPGSFDVESTIRNMSILANLK